VITPRRLAYYLASLPTLRRGVRNWPAVALALLRPPPRRPFEVRLRDGCRFRARTALDVWILKEVCLDRDYERGGFAVQPGWTVVDVGAGLGEFCVCVARAQPTCRVYAFEPLAGSYALLQDNVRLNGLTNLTAFPRALGARAGDTLLHAAPAAARSRTAGTGGAGAAVRVPVTTLGAVLDELAIRRCDLLKLDCEGAEYEILYGAEPGALARIVHLALEYHDGVAGSCGADLAAFLHGRGFAVRTVPNRAYPDRLGLLYATRRPPA
jgi:FkbM family methyltransferase